MTRKDYQAIAEAIGRANPIITPADRITLTNTYRAVAAVMAADNPRFDEGRFMAAVWSAVDEVTADLLTG